MIILIFHFFIFASVVLSNFNINDEVLFGINWKDEKSEHSLGGITIHTKDKESFRCFIPQSVKDKYDNSFNEEYSGPTELELLYPLFNNKLCSLKIESYWTYEICHGRHVRQFHEETNQGKSTTLQQYHLGVLTSTEKNSESEIRKGSGTSSKSKQIPSITINSVNFPYFKINMTNGSQCDLIGTSRSINVLYVCQAEGRGEIYEIQEIRTCQYQAIVFTKLLCSHPKYKVTDNHVNEISCYPLTSSPVPKSLALIQTEIKSEVSAISSLDGLFNDNFNMGSQIKVEAFNENGIIVYRIKTVGKPNLQKSEETSKDHVDVTENNENSENQKLSEQKTDKKFPEVEKDLSSQSKSLGGSKPSDDSNLLQKFTSGKFCVDGGEGWWRHRVCYNRKITQYHLELNMETSEIILGLWKESKHLKWLKNNPDKRPLSETKDRLEIHQYFSDGSYCDDIKANRDAILKIRCGKDNSSAILISFLEPSVCSYIVTIESSLFCSMVKEADEFGLLKSKEQ